MKSNINENIKQYRKQKNLTQEQLAEAMGVSVGAVSKWESGASIPELGLIMELADFFGISVDALLGYKMRDNTAEETAERIDSLQDAKKYEEAIAEAEKALKKFPNNFRIVYQSALTYFMKGLERHDNSALKKSLELYKSALNLCDGPDEKGIGPATIYSEMAEAYDCLGMHKEAVEILKKHNDNGMYDAEIGYICSMNFRDDPKSIEYLSDSMLRSLATIFRTSIGFSNYYGNVYKDYRTALDALLMCRDINNIFRVPEKTSYLDKNNVIILVACADFAIKLGETEKAREYLLEAKKTAEFFDATPNYSAENIKFYKKENLSYAGDNFGETAMEGLENTVKDFIKDDPLVYEIWHEIKENQSC